MENSHLLQENKRLSQEDFSVQQHSVRLTEGQLARERPDMDMSGGQGTRAHQGMNTHHSNPESLLAREQATGLT